MRTFSLRLSGARQSEHIENICSFVGADASGSFGIMADHARFMTALSFGLARYRGLDSGWRYLALPGAILYFAGNQLVVTTRRYVVSANYEDVNTVLRDEMSAEERERHVTKASLRRMEEELLKRLWRASRPSISPAWTTSYER
jgi:F-type H+-transporting ATPase subunit epsilon